MNKILIVEDEVLIARYLKNIVDNNGFISIGEVSSYDKALLYLKDADLLIIDITLQGDKSGLDLAQYLKTNYNIPFIFITALSDKETIAKIVELEPAAYLVKPILEINLITAVSLALQKLKSNIVKLTVGTQTYNININDLVYVESEHVYINLFFKNQSNILIRMSLQKLLESFSEIGLKRINKSQAINPRFISKSIGHNLYIGDNVFKVSPNYDYDIDL